MNLSRIKHFNIICRRHPIYSTFGPGYTFYLVSKKGKKAFLEFYNIKDTIEAAIAWSSFIEGDD
jgi:hypothetical protein